jgi:hypothetical protein
MSTGQLAIARGMIWRGASRTRAELGIANSIQIWLLARWI